MEDLGDEIFPRVEVIRRVPVFIQQALGDVHQARRVALLAEHLRRRVEDPRPGPF
ncbi:MAG: hypothetical protein QM760_21660 [Nibricoccus sp.]